MRTRKKRRREYRDTGRSEIGDFSSCYVSNVEQLGVLEAREGNAYLPMQVMQGKGQRDRNGT